MNLNLFLISNIVLRLLSHVLSVNSSYNDIQNNSLFGFIMLMKRLSSRFLVTNVVKYLQ